MSRNNALLAGFLLAVGIWSGAPVEAVPVTYLHDYGNNPGLVAPTQGGSGNMAPNHVTVVETANDSSFRDAIDFGGAGFGMIHSLTLTLSIAKAGETGEDWRVFGSTNGGTGVGDRLQLGAPLKNGSSWSVVLSSGSVFDQALAAGSLAFWFGPEGKPGRLPHDFWLYSASLAVDGTVQVPVPAPVPPSPIPLPATGLLLIGSLGGFMLLRRRARVAPVT